MDKVFIGGIARLLNSIPVVRPQDNIHSGTGHIFMKSGCNFVIYGLNTKFLKELHPRDSISIAGYPERMEITEIVSDTEVKIKICASPASVTLSSVDSDGNDCGIVFKITPYVDQSVMFREVVARLHLGQAVGIFPEGGSHDRTELLPLKPGVALMALEALSCNPEMNLTIIPVGLSYFHADQFRSRAVVEYGDPIRIPSELVTKYNDVNTNNDNREEQRNEMRLDSSWIQ